MRRNRHQAKLRREPFAVPGENRSVCRRRQSCPRREFRPPRSGMAQNLSDGSVRAALAEVDIAIIFDEDRFGEVGRRGRGERRSAAARPGGPAGAVQDRQLSKRGMRRRKRERTPTPMRRPALWRRAFRAGRPEFGMAMCECGMNGKPARSPVPALLLAITKSLPPL